MLFHLFKNCQSQLIHIVMFYISIPQSIPFCIDFYAFSEKTILHRQLSLFCCKYFCFVLKWSEVRQKQKKKIWKKKNF